jgi:Monooxygenase af470-like
VAKVRRQTVDLTGHPDLVVVYLGMRVKTLLGLKALASFGPKIRRAVEAKPDGLLFHQLFLFGLLPPHVGIRQYWRDFDALERWVRSDPHRTWWRDLLRGGSGTAFWHETYFMRGGMESIFLDMDCPTGLLSFASAQEARGAMFSARRRLRLAGEELAPPALSEEELYS